MELHRQADKFARDAKLLKQQIDAIDGESTERSVSLALSTAKRVRRDANVVTRELARTLDELQPKEGTST